MLCFLKVINMVIAISNWCPVMSQESQPKAKDKKANKQQENTNTSGGYQTPIDPDIRQTGVASEGDGKPTARPESPENDSVPGSPNQGTESR
jgi:hypothetical protein